MSGQPRFLIVAAFLMIPALSAEAGPACGDFTLVGGEKVINIIDHSPEGKGPGDERVGWRALADEATRTDLVIEGSVVVEARGPSRVDPVDRLRERQRLQELLNRVSAAEGKELARIARELGRSGPALAALSERARLGS